MRLGEQVSPQQRKEKAGVSLDANMRSFRTRFPMKWLHGARPKAAIVFGCGGDVNGAVEATSILVPQMT